MITAGLLYIVLGFINLILLPLKALPDVTLPTQISDAITSAGSALAVASNVLPVVTLLLVIAAFLAVEGGIFLYKIIKWVYSKIPGVN